MTKRRVLNEYQLERLKEHKYAAEGSSLLDPYMQPFWRWLVEQIPLTWAPNAITLWGLIGNIMSTIFLMLYCPRGYGEAPWWCYTLCAVFLFVYQSLDAIDGKQARRTGSSSPLGELFDHGCDAMSMVIIIVGVCISTQLGSVPYLFSTLVFLGTILFYAAQWKTATIGKMQFNFLDVTEGQFLVMSLYMFNCIFGESFWTYEVVKGTKLNAILGTPFVAVGAYILKSYLSVICNSEDRLMKGDSRSTTDSVSYQTRQSLIPSRFLPAIPITIFSVLGMACTFFSSSRVMENNVVLYHVMFGIVGTKLCCNVLVSYMTKTEMPCVDSIFIGPFLLLVAEICHFPETCFLWVAFVFCTVKLLLYVCRVCKDICDYLNIFCFKITPV